MVASPTIDRWLQAIPEQLRFSSRMRPCGGRATDNDQKASVEIVSDAFMPGKLSIVRQGVDS